MVALSVGALMMVGSSAYAQKSGAKAERGLLGVNLYDSGTKVLSKYGTPDEIQAVNVGGGTSAVGGGFGPRGGGPSFGGPGGAPRGAPGSGGRPGAMGAADMRNDPFSFGNDMLQIRPGGIPGAPGGQGPGGIPAPSGLGGRPGGFPGAPGGQGPSGFPGAPGGAGFPGSGGRGGGGGFGGGGAAESTSFTRWVYNRSGSKYGFVLDKNNRVIQIEAIGIQNAAVRTSRGIGFGATFAQVLGKYPTPDGYDIAGDNLTVKFLNHAKVAFRMTRLGEKKPQVVTGIVVAAAKG